MPTTWLFETAVPLHREGEGAPYTGLKPAGLDRGPVVPRAEKTIEQGNVKEVIEFLLHTTEEELQARFKHALSKKNYNENNVDAAREYVQAMLGFVLYAHGLYAYMKGGGEHGKKEGSGHEH